MMIIANVMGWLSSIPNEKKKQQTRQYKIYCAIRWMVKKATGDKIISSSTEFMLRSYITIGCWKNENCSSFICYMSETVQLIHTRKNRIENAWPWFDNRNEVESNQLQKIIIKSYNSDENN